MARNGGRGGGQGGGRGGGGVTYIKKEEKWAAKITLGGTVVNLGLYANKIDAARAYDTGGD